MALSYSVMIVIEALVLVPLFSYLLLSRKNTSNILLQKKVFTLIAISLIAGSFVLFLVPKINLLENYDYTKLTSDAWDHYSVTEIWGNTGVIPTDVYPYYSNFPLTYVPQIILHQLTGLALFDSMTVYYMIMGIAGLAITIGLSNELMSRAPRNERILFAGISGVVYSMLQYFNLLFVQQYPLSIATVSALFCLYCFVLLSRKRKRSMVYLMLAGAVLTLSHPFAPIFTSILFLVYFITNKLVKSKNVDPYQKLITRRIALLMSIVLIISGLTYSVFVATGTFESGVRWSELNTRYTVQKLTSSLFESTASGVGQSFEGRYQAIDTIIYALNWALPASSSISMLIAFLSGRLRVQDSESGHLFFTLSIVSTVLFILTFLFSFVEFAFSRYFGAFALTFNIPLTSYLIMRIVKVRKSLIRYAILSVIGLSVISSVTDPTMLPKINFGDTAVRNSEIYPSSLDLLAWSDFYSLASYQNKLVQTNLNAGPINHYKVINNYQNEIVVSPKKYTPNDGNALLIIDKDKLESSNNNSTSSILVNQTMNRVYDNSKIYFGE